jgi:hypothetical protein
MAASRTAPSSNLTNEDPKGMLEQQVTSIRQQLDQSVLDTSLAIRNILTADQVSHLAEVHAKLGELRAQIENLIGPGPAGMDMLLESPSVVSRANIDN